MAHTKGVPGMRGWTDIGSDASWDDYGGKWARRGKNAVWYVIVFTNMHEACGEDECRRDGQDQYIAEVHAIDLAQVDVGPALKSCGMRIAASADGRRIITDQGDIIATEGEASWELAQVEACASYGNYAPIDSFSGNTRPSWVRAQARRSAESLMRDAAAMAERMARPVNKLGSTAAEYMIGDLDAALDRGPFDPSKNLMRKLHGRIPLDENGNPQ